MVDNGFIVDIVLIDDVVDIVDSDVTFPNPTSDLTGMDYSDDREENTYFPLRESMHSYITS